MLVLHPGAFGNKKINDVFLLQDPSTMGALRQAGSDTVRTLGTAKAPKSRDRATTRQISQNRVRLGEREIVFG